MSEKDRKIVNLHDSPPEAEGGVRQLGEALDRRAQPGVLWRKEGDKVRCVACAHRCLLRPDQRGVCKVRFNRDGELQVPYGYTAGMAVDPVEKKPFYHVTPGSQAFTFGMLGCDLHCAYCQNWLTSQALRDPEAVGRIQAVSPAQMVGAAKRAGARLMVSSYNEPLITAEWAAAVFDAAQQEDLLCAMVTNGNATPDALDYLQMRLSAVKVDLKSFRDQQYRFLGGTLEAVTQTIQGIHARGLWLEVVTLLVPGFNDSEAELRDMARFLASVSVNIPWHLTAFHPDYRMTWTRRTRPEDLMRAAEIGAEEGLHFVYAGNLPGRVGEWENTRCPRCQKTLIRRAGFLVQECWVRADGHCPGCRGPLPGLWDGLNRGDGPGPWKSIPPRVLPKPF